jgi:hypothetical protein
MSFLDIDMVLNFVNFVKDFCLSSLYWIWDRTKKNGARHRKRSTRMYVFTRNIERDSHIELAYRN